MNNDSDFYRYWDNNNLITTFNNKNEASFFNSEIKLLEIVEFEHMQSVLDIGCSCGRFLELLTKRFSYTGSFTGIDISKPSIDQARQNYPNKKFIHGNALVTDFPVRFDLINATGVFQHEPHFTSLLAKMYELSNRYILFDIKLVKSQESLTDIAQSYCELDGQRIHIIAIAAHQLIPMLQTVCLQKGSITLYGYETPFNQSTKVPDTIKSWFSTGVLIDKNSSTFSISVNKEIKKIIYI